MFLFLIDTRFFRNYMFPESFDIKVYFEYFLINGHIELEAFAVIYKRLEMKQIHSIITVSESIKTSCFSLQDRSHTFYEVSCSLEKLSLTSMSFEQILFNRYFIHN